MPIADILQNLNLFVDGRGYAGKVAEIILPKITPVLQEYNAGGLSAPVDVEMAAHGKLEAELTLRAFDIEALRLFNIGMGRHVPLTVRGALQDDDGTKHTVIINMSGTIKEFDMGTWKNAEEATLKLGLSLRYYRLERDGAEIYELDPVNMVCRVNGVDQLAETRAALGI